MQWFQLETMFFYHQMQWFSYGLTSKVKLTFDGLLLLMGNKVSEERALTDAQLSCIS